MSAIRLGEALAALEAQWAAQGAPIAKLLEPGLPADHIRATIADLGFVPSDELVTWFEWRNGAGSSVADVGPALEPFTLATALTAREEMVAIETESGIRRPPPEGWDPLWLPLAFFIHGEYFSVALEDTPSATSSVWRFDFEFAPGQLVASSVAEMVSGWVQLLEGGWWRWDPDRGQWGSPPPGHGFPPADLQRFAAE